MFWVLCDQMPRIEAHKQRLQVQVATCTGTKEGVEQLLKAIDKEMGTVVSAPRADPRNERDPGAFDLLRRLA